MKNVYIFLLVGFLAATGCTSSRIKLSSLNQDTVHEENLEVSRMANDSIRVVTAFESTYERREAGTTKEYLIFDTEVTNLSDRSIAFHPRDFAIYGLDSKKNFVQQQVNAQLVSNWYQRALDPDTELTKIASNITREKRAMNFHKALNTVLFIGLAVADASNQSHTNRRTYTDYALTQSGINAGWTALMSKRMVDHARFANRMDQFQWEKNTFQQETFRAMILRPGESIRGKMLLEANRKAQYYQINFPSHSQSISFLYQQSLEKK